MIEHGVGPSLRRAVDEEFEDPAEVWQFVADFHEEGRSTPWAPLFTSEQPSAS